MTSVYDHEQVREFWQYMWSSEDVYSLPVDVSDPTYVLGMFPYTSGTLHMGHIRNYAITDAIARFHRMRGESVLHPMGWDAFGLPAENAAYERHTDPKSWTYACIERMRDELETMGFGYDWDREITTCDPSYYRWNQWLFLKLYEAGLVEYTGATVNWCPDCETVLADAQVEMDDGARRCWRCDTPVEGRELDQWFLKITDYVEELLDGLDDLDGWPENVKEIQRNWIGRRTGANIEFDVPGFGTLTAFSTRPDTVYGATFMAISPGHDLASAIADGDDSVKRFIDSNESSSAKSSALDGIDTGEVAVHPLTGEELPIYIATYVLDDVGTGAIMGVPAHNERDHRFATVFDLPVVESVQPSTSESTSDPTNEPYLDHGVLIDSGPYSGLDSETAIDRLIEDEPSVEAAVTYRLRDWSISRQRYWGTPIPIIHCDDCGRVPVPIDDLPVELPEYVETRGNPLAEIDDFVETQCPECGQTAERETDTMDTFFDSSWYFLRFISPHYVDGPFDPELANEWMPVDVYVGGEEHATLHLLYIRFFTRALADIGLLEHREPVRELINQGTVLYDGQKMSKSKGNVVSPDEYGEETTRLFLLSAAHPAQDFEWTANRVNAAYDLQRSLFDIVDRFVDATEFRTERRDIDRYLEDEVDRSVAIVTEEYERYRFHRAASEIRRLLRLFGRYETFETPHYGSYRDGLLCLVQLTAPLAPHLAEELWNKLRGNGLVVSSEWPEAERTVERSKTERQLVDRTIEDIRDIVNVVDISDPERITVEIAPEWKFAVTRTVHEQSDETVLVDAIRDLDVVQSRRDSAVDYAFELQADPQGVDISLSQADERSVFERAKWLIEDEFDTSVVIRSAEKDAESAARPGRPEIQIDG